VPQVATVAVAALYVTDRADVQPIGCRLNPHARACSLCSQTTTRSSGLPFNGLHPRNPVIHVIKWITTHLPTPKGWKAELAWLVDP